MKILLEYIKKYKITYISILIFFILGIVLGNIIMQKKPSNQKDEIVEYIIELMNESKDNGIDKITVFKKSIIENVKFVGILYLLGCTIIASLAIYIVIIYKGVVLGYTGAAFIITYGLKEGLNYILVTLILHNIIYLPIIFLLAISGIRMYKEIMKKTINFKVELLRHSIIMLICLVFCIIASGVEAYFSTIIFEFL